MWHIHSPRDHVQALQSGKLKDAPKTFQFQNQLAPLPVPTLAETTQKYLKSVEAAVSPAQYAETVKIVAEFSKPGGVGPRLQAQLEEHAKERQKEGKSWLEDWWLKMAYHAWKDPIVITSNWYTIYKDHPVSGYMDVNQLTRAACLVTGFLVYKELLESQTVPVDYSRKLPLCMDQSTRIFSTTRIPGDQVADHNVTYCFKDSRHIVVLRKDQIFAVEVFDAQYKRISDVDLQAQFRWIVEETECFSEQPPIGVLTGDRRDTWAKARAKLTANPRNAASIDVVDRALFAVCLDETSPATRHELAQGTFHNTTGRNRWFDKCFNVIVFKNGKAGLNAEHSPLDAPPLAHGCSYFASYYENEPSYIALRSHLDLPRSKSLPLPAKVVWEITPDLKQTVQQAGVDVANFIATYHTECLEYEGYGANFLKQANLSPDAFIQMVIQLAYYKIYRTCTATYETAQTRKFFHGRTETVRSLSNESKAFVIGMENPKLSPPEKFQLLRKAIDSHNSYMTNASEGKGVDRHLLGLMMCGISNGEPTPALFADPSFGESRHFRLSTSNLTPGPAFYGGFGPVVDDGYGVCYCLRDSACWFSVSSRTNCYSTDTRQMMRAIASSLEDLRALYLVQQSTPKL